jgi:hypothetical protein
MSITDKNKNSFLVIERGRGRQREAYNLTAIYEPIV